MLRRFTYDPSEPVVLRQYPAEPLAAVDLALLEAAGIPATLRRESFSELGLPAVSIVVRRGDVDSAREEIDPRPDARHHG